MFGEEILNGKQLTKQLGISRTFLYSLLDEGLPNHRLGNRSRRYYILSEVEEWLISKELR